MTFESTPLYILSQSKQNDVLSNVVANCRKSFFESLQMQAR